MIGAKSASVWHCKTQAAAVRSGSCRRWPTCGSAELHVARAHFDTLWADMLECPPTRSRLHQLGQLLASPQSRMPRASPSCFWRDTSRPAATIAGPCQHGPTIVAQDFRVIWPCAAALWAGQDKITSFRCGSSQLQCLNALEGPPVTGANHVSVWFGEARVIVVDTRPRFRRAASYAAIAGLRRLRVACVWHGASRECDADARPRPFRCTNLSSRLGLPRCLLVGIRYVALRYTIVCPEPRADRTPSHIACPCVTRPLAIGIWRDVSKCVAARSGPHFI